MVGVGERVAKDLDGGDEQDGAEEEEGPGERRDELGTERDEEAAEHDRAGDADEQHPLLVLLRHRESGEQQHEDEEVVDRQGLLHEVAGVVLHTRLASVGAPQPHAEGDGDGDVERRPGHGLAHRDLVWASRDEEVEHEQTKDGADGQQPEGGSADRVG
jgi:hypothetical protein